MGIAPDYVTLFEGHSPCKMRDNVNYALFPAAPAVGAEVAFGKSDCLDLAGK